MRAIASQITSLTIVYSTVYSDANQRKYQSSASLAFVRRIYRGPVNSPHKWPVTRKCFHLMTSLCHHRNKRCHVVNCTLRDIYQSRVYQNKIILIKEKCVWKSLQNVDHFVQVAMNKCPVYIFHDDVIKWKHFLRYWPFVRGIHRSLVNSPHKGQWRGVWCFLWFAPE